MVLLGKQFESFIKNCDGDMSVVEKNIADQIKWIESLAENQLHQMNE